MLGSSSKQVFDRLGVAVQVHVNGVAAQVDIGHCAKALKLCHVFARVPLHSEGDNGSKGKTTVKQNGMGGNASRDISPASVPSFSPGHLK